MGWGMGGVKKSNEPERLGWGGGGSVGEKVE